MKRIFTILRDLRIQILLIATTLSLLVWFVGPYIRFLPLQSSTHRLIVILGFMMAWGISNIFVRQTNNKTNTSAFSTANWEIEIAQAKLRIIAQGFSEALRFLKKKLAKKWFYRYDLPWYLVVGPESSGKTSFLTQSGLNLVSSGGNPLKNVNATQYCDWWFSDKAVFLDLAGTLFSPKTANERIPHLWQGLIRLLKQHRRRQPIDGILLVIDFATLATQSREQRQQLLDNICQPIQLLNQYQGCFPLYLIISKCDQIAGFNESFADVSAEERNQVCGLTLPFGLSQQSLTSTLDLHFNQWLQRLHQQSLVRIHREFDLPKRALIKDFIVQVEAQKNALMQVATQLHSSKTAFCGIYFTSSQQAGRPIDCLLRPINQAFGIQTPPPAMNAPVYRSYFVPNTFQRILTPHTLESAWLLSLRQSHKWYWVSGLLLLIAGACWTYSYFENTTNFKALKNALYQRGTHDPTISAAYPYLNLLNILQKAESALQTSSISSTKPIGFNQNKKLKQAVNKDYQQILIQQFLPQLQRTLEAQLRNNNDNPEQLFNTLKTYLMLAETQHLNRSFVTNWFHNYWQQTIPNNYSAQMELTHHLGILLKQSTLSVKLDQNLIKNVRSNLNNLPPEKLTFLNLVNEYTDVSPRTLATVGDRFILDNVPMLYLADHFDDIYNQVIPRICSQLAEGNWVLGMSTPTNLMLTQPVINQLTRDVREVYVMHYLMAWQQQLEKVKIADFQNLDQISQFVTALNSPDSPIVNVLTSIQKNLKPIANIRNYRNEVNQQIQQINALLGYAQSNTTKAAINDLTAYLAKISQSSDRNKAALEVAKMRMENEGRGDAITNFTRLAEQAPAPFNNWFSVIASNSWKMILQSAQTQLNTIWQQEVYPVYAKTIDQHYPFFKDASNEMSVGEFVKFFGPNGVIDNFFTTHLQAFVDTEQLYWVWKEVDGRRIDISQSTLEVFIRAALVRKMFFPADSLEPFVRFSLIPTILEPSLQNAIIKINGAQMDYRNGLTKPSHFAWPTRHGTANLELIDNANKHTEISENGPWAMFHLLDKAIIQQTPNSKLYNVTFDLDGKTVHYELIADSLINPFIPGIINNFRCPDKL